MFNAKDQIQVRAVSYNEVATLALDCLGGQPPKFKSGSYQSPTHPTYLCPQHVEEFEVVVTANMFPYVIS